MNARTTFAMIAIATGCSAAVTAQAASIYLTPTQQAVDPTALPMATTASFDMWMDFAPSELTVGGGIDVDVTGVATFGSFAPSAWFTMVPDPAFTGHGTLRADADYEIHFGSFNGLSGVHNLGTLTLNLNQPLVPGTSASIALAANTFFGGFYSATSPVAMNVSMTGGTVGVVPEPRAVLMLLAGLGVVAVTARRRRLAA